MTTHAAPLPHAVADLPPDYVVGRTWWSNAQAFKRDNLAFFKGVSDTNDVSMVHMGAEQVVFNNDPAAIHRVLVGNAKNYSKDTRGYRRMRYLLGNGLLTSNGSFWLRQRRIAQPAFHRRRLANMMDVMCRLTAEHMEQWRVKAAAGPFEVDLQAEMMRLTMRIVGMTMLGVDTDKDAQNVSAALTTALHRTNELLQSILPGAVYWPTPKNAGFWRARKVLDDVVLGIIAERRKSGASGDDLLGMLMETEDEDTKERMTDIQLRDEVMTMFLAGHETTATALTWTMALLNSNEEIFQHATDEVRGTPVYTGGMPPQLDLLPRIFDESLRLYPPAWLIGRAAIDDDHFGGYDIPRGKYVLISPYMAHRHKDYWDNPDAFDPDRFLPGKEFAPGSYIPFIAGPRQCIGKAFAKAEAQIILMGMLRDFSVRLVGDFPKMDPAITLRPRGEVRVRIEKR